MVSWPPTCAWLRMPTTEPWLLIVVEVTGSITPVIGRPWLAWNPWTAVWVPGPNWARENSPAGMACPNFFRLVWIAFTWAPLAPRARTALDGFMGESPVRPRAGLGLPEFFLV